MPVTPTVCRLASLAAFLLTGGTMALAQSAAPVETIIPEFGTATRTVQLSGSIRARRVAALSPRLPGLVAEVNVDAGDRVAVGDVLVRLDSELARLAIAEAEASLEESAAALQEARRLRDEGRRLVGDNYVSETEVEARESRYAMAQAAVARSESRLASAQAQFERHAVIAPFDGVISRKLTEAGEWVQTGTPVAELVGSDDLWLDVQAPQQYWPDLVPEARVSVTLDALPDRRVAAFVHTRVPVSDPAARTFLVRLALEDPDELAGQVTPGMSGRASFTLSGDAEVVRLPRDALIRYPDGTTTIWVVVHADDGTRAREVEVTVGRTVGNSVEIVSELDPLRPVVVRGNEVLSENQRVEVRSGSTGSH